MLDGTPMGVELGSPAVGSSPEAGWKAPISNDSPIYVTRAPNPI